MIYQLFHSSSLCKPSLSSTRIVSTCLNFVSGLRLHWACRTVGRLPVYKLHYAVALIKPSPEILHVFYLDYRSGTCSIMQQHPYARGDCWRLCFTVYWALGIFLGAPDTIQMRESDIAKKSPLAAFCHGRCADLRQGP